MLGILRIFDGNWQIIIPSGSIINLSDADKIKYSFILEYMHFTHTSEIEVVFDKYKGNIEDLSPVNLELQMKIELFISYKGAVYTPNLTDFERYVIKNLEEYRIFRGIVSGLQATYNAIMQQFLKSGVLGSNSLNINRISDWKNLVNVFKLTREFELKICYPIWPGYSTVLKINKVRNGTIRVVTDTIEYYSWDKMADLLNDSATALSRAIASRFDSRKANLYSRFKFNKNDKVFGQKLLASSILYIFAGRGEEVLKVLKQLKISENLIKKLQDCIPMLLTLAAVETHRMPLCYADLLIQLNHIATKDDLTFFLAFSNRGKSIMTGEQGFPALKLLLENEDEKQTAIFFPHRILNSSDNNIGNVACQRAYQMFLYLFKSLDLGIADTKLMRLKNDLLISLQSKSFTIGYAPVLPALHQALNPDHSFKTIVIKALCDTYITDIIINYIEKKPPLIKEALEKVHNLDIDIDIMNSLKFTLIKSIINIAVEKKDALLITNLLEANSDIKLVALNHLISLVKEKNNAELSQWVSNNCWDKQKAELEGGLEEMFVDDITPRITSTRFLNVNKII